MLSLKKFPGNCSGRVISDYCEERISKAFETCNKLKLFLKKASCETKWKMQVYNAVIISKLIHGLETMYPNDSPIKRLDAFQMTGLRHMMEIEHAYWSRCSKEEILERANKILNGWDDITKNWKETI